MVCHVWLQDVMESVPLHFYCPNLLHSSTIAVTENYTIKTHVSGPPMPKFEANMNYIPPHGLRNKFLQIICVLISLYSASWELSYLSITCKDLFCRMRCTKNFFGKCAKPFLFFFCHCET